MSSEPAGNRDTRIERFTGGTELRRREFRDFAGRKWSACERRIPRAEWTSADEQSDLAGYGVGWLYFESAEHVRRLRLYSKHWHQLSDMQLERLCRRARPAQREPQPDPARRSTESSP